MYLKLSILFLYFLIFESTFCETTKNENELNKSSDNNLFVKYNTIEGKVFFPSELPFSSSWITETQVVLNYGSYYGFIKRDGSFEVTNLPPGSYIVDVTNPNYVFEPVRVDINSKGKIRARKINFIQTNVVKQIQYPLKFKPKMPFKYFQVRESWRLTDFLLNPMVLMMIVPLLLVMVLPKMVNLSDAEAQREMQNLQMPKYDVPELSEMMTSFFNKGSSSNKLPIEKSKNKNSKKKVS